MMNVPKWVIILIIMVIVTILLLSQMLFILEEFIKSPASQSITTTSVFSRGAVKILIVVLVDNNQYREGLETAWGLSIYVEVNETKILFDTGPEPGILERNAKRLGIDLSKVDFVVISHVHGDHTGGLGYIASVKPGVKVFIPPEPGLQSYVEKLGLTTIVINRTTEIAENVYIVQPLYGPPIEEALAIKTSRGLIILVGCSHPGVVNIAKQAVKDIGIKPYMIIGGFHMWGASRQEIEEVSKELIEIGVEKIYPIHCSGNEIRHYLEVHYPDKYGDGGVGLSLRQ